MNNQIDQYGNYDYVNDISTQSQYQLPDTASVSETFDKKLPITRQRIKSNSRLLPQNAINIMTAWYDKHYANPYPTYREFEQLAIAGSITINQVKQWFVNVRRRTHNQFRKKRDAVKKRLVTNESNDSSCSFQSEMNEIFASIENTQASISSDSSNKCTYSSIQSSSSQYSPSGSYSPSASSNYSTPFSFDSRYGHSDHSKGPSSCYSSPASSTSNYYYNNQYYPYSGPYESTPCSSYATQFNNPNYHLSPYANSTSSSSCLSSRFSSSSSTSSSSFNSESVQTGFYTTFSDPYSSTISSLYDSQYANKTNTAINQSNRY
jgi:hypothetical protein